MFTSSHYQGLTEQRHQRGYASTIQLVGSNIQRLVLGLGLLGLTQVSTVLVLGGCHAKSDSVPSADARQIVPLRWEIMAGGHLCLIYQPQAVLAQPEQPAPLLLALHDFGEYCEDSLGRWRSVAEAKRLNLIAINWTAGSPTEASMDQLVQDLSRIAQDFAVTSPTKKMYLSGRGAATPVVFSAGCNSANAGFWAGLSLIGGVPDGDWQHDPNQAMIGIVSEPPAIHYIMGKSDSDRAAAQAFTKVWQEAGYLVQLTEVEGQSTSPTTIFDFAGIFDWLLQVSEQ